MPKRYFYTDPRKASLMLSEHNIHMYMGAFESNDYDAYNRPMATMLIEDCLYRTKYLEKFKNWDKKIYMHPSCYEMLKPQVGDLVRLVGCGHFVNDNRFGDKSHIFIEEIIQRNGKAFFTPEVEEVE